MKWDGVFFLFSQYEGVLTIFGFLVDAIGKWVFLVFGLNFWL